MKNILLISDAQKGFLKFAPGLEKKLIQLTDSFDIVIGTQYLNHNNSIFEKALGYSGMIKGEEIDIPEALSEKMDAIIKKYGYGCVCTTFITRIRGLANGYPERIYLAGMDTDACILMAAMELFDAQILPIVLADYCASTNGEKAHEEGLSVLGRIIGKEQIIYGKHKAKTADKTAPQPHTCKYWGHNPIADKEVCNAFIDTGVYFSDCVGEDTCQVMIKERLRSGS